VSFVHLHSHSSYSVLDGAAKLPEMVARAKKLGQPAIAVTDHGTLTGAYEFWKECNAQGIKPIIGYEAYLAPTTVATRTPVFWGNPDQRRHDVSGRGAYLHITLLAAGPEGLLNLYKLHSESFKGDRSYYKNRIDLELLTEYNAGIIATTGCAGGAIATALRLEQPDRADEWMSRFVDIFGDRLYVELMYHGITDAGDDGFDEYALNQGLIALAEKYDVPTVLTNDCHYVTEADSVGHDALLCVQTRAKIDDTNRFRFTGSGFYLKSESEMHVVVGMADLPDDAAYNTLAIADRVQSYDSVMKQTTTHWPQVGTDLRELVMKSDRYNSEHQGRLDEELAVIEGQGFPPYFTVLADAIGWSKANGIAIGPGRGSAGGSLVSFVLGITDINPLEHGLLFERFLNPERVSLPDIDIDVDDTQRDRLLDYLREKHGPDRVAQIMTIGTVGAKAALKDASRVLGFPFSKGTELVEYLPPALFGRQPTLDEMPPQLDPDNKKIVNVAKKLNGLVRSTGVHAAGVVVSADPIVNYIPTSWKEGVQYTGFDAGGTEAMGLVKIDFLGLRNISIIQSTLDMIGKPWSFLLELPLTDMATYQLLQSGNSDGVFQLDSDGMKRLLTKVKPKEFNDIAAILALYRPGPMGVGAHTEYAKKKGTGRRNPAIHPELDGPLAPILDETYGLIVYQEQIMKILQRVGGYSLGEADLVRKAMGKKDRELLKRLKPEFMDRVGNWYGTEAADALWHTIEPFADYAFNKAHSVGYGMLSYWTAYLKAHHPREYMSALLSSVSEDPDRLGTYLEETRRLGIKLLPPSINGGKSFTPGAHGIHYGLHAIKGFGENAFEKLKPMQPFKDLDDFFKRAPAAVLNAGVLHALVRSGALDTLDGRRVQLDGVAEELAGKALESRKKRSSGRTALFRQTFGLEQLSRDIEDAAQYSVWERETLGISLTAERMILVPKEELSEAEWDWVADLIAHCPGQSEVFVQIGEQMVATDWSVDRESVLDRLVVLAAFDLERMK